MDTNYDVKRFIQRLRKGAVKKSIMASLVVSLFALAVFAGAGWYFGFTAVWVYAVCFAGVACAAFPLFYFLKYHKSEREAALAIDELGLEERMITMESLKGVDSYMARRQREDTLEALSKVNEKRLSLVLSTALVACLAVALPLGAGFTTVSALAAEGVLPSGREVAANGKLINYSLVYTAGEGGSLEGRVNQRVASGKEGSYVIAQADSGYIFIKWSDGLKDSARRDIPTDTDIELEAIFAKLGDYDPDEGLLGPGDKNGNKGEGEQSNSDAPPSDSSSPNEYPSKDPSDGGGAGGGESDAPANQIIDGETFYGDKPYDDAYQDAMDRLNGDSDLSDSDKGLIGSYFDAIGR